MYAAPYARILQWQNQKSSTLIPLLPYIIIIAVQSSFSPSHDEQALEDCLILSPCILRRGKYLSWCPLLLPRKWLMKRCQGFFLVDARKKRTSGGPFCTRFVWTTRSPSGRLKPSQKTEMIRNLYLGCPYPLLLHFFSPIDLPNIVTEFQLLVFIFRLVLSSPPPNDSLS